MAIQKPPKDIVFECPLCSGSLVTDSTEIGKVVDCPHCRESMTIPRSTGVTDDTEAPGVRRIIARSKGPAAPQAEVPAANHSALIQEIEALKESLAQSQAEAEGLREDLRLAQEQDHRSTEQLQSRVAALQRHLDSSIQLSMARDADDQKLKIALARLESGALEVLRHLAQKKPVLKPTKPE